VLTTYVPQLELAPSQLVCAAISCVVWSTSWTRALIRITGKKEKLALLAPAPIPLADEIYTVVQHHRVMTA
jgi:hypothetical protein